MSALLEDVLPRAMTHEALHIRLPSALANELKALAAANQLTVEALVESVLRTALLTGVAGERPSLWDHQLARLEDEGIADAERGALMSQEVVEDLVRSWSDGMSRRDEW